MSYSDDPDGNIQTRGYEMTTDPAPQNTFWVSLKSFIEIKGLIVDFWMKLKIVCKNMYFLYKQNIIAAGYMLSGWIIEWMEHLCMFEREEMWLGDDCDTIIMYCYFTVKNLLLLCVYYFIWSRLQRNARKLYNVEPSIMLEWFIQTTIDIKTIVKSL